MKKGILFLVVVLSITANGQKLGNGFVSSRQIPISTLNTEAAATRMHSRVSELASSQPLGIHQFRDPRGSNFEPIYFEVYPNPASEWLGCDFPANSNIQFVRIVNVAGQVIASYHRWDRLFYIGNLQSGLYQLQIVQNNFMAHSTPFYKR